jgi:hypothetical protein
MKSERVEKEVQQMLLKLKEVEHQDDTLLLKSIDAKLATLESSRDLSQIFFHIDMYVRRPPFYTAALSFADPHGAGGGGALLQGCLLRKRRDQRQSAPAWYALTQSGLLLNHDWFAHWGVSWCVSCAWCGWLFAAQVSPLPWAVTRC